MFKLIHLPPDIQVLFSAAVSVVTIVVFESFRTAINVTTKDIV